MGLIRLVLVHLQVSCTIAHRYVLKGLEDVFDKIANNSEMLISTSNACYKHQALYSCVLILSN